MVSNRKNNAQCNGNNEKGGRDAAFSSIRCSFSEVGFSFRVGANANARPAVAGVRALFWPFEFCRPQPAAGDRRRNPRLGFLPSPILREKASERKKRPRYPRSARSVHDRQLFSLRQSCAQRPQPSAERFDFAERLVGVLHLRAFDRHDRATASRGRIGRDRSRPASAMRPSRACVKL